MAQSARRRAPVARGPGHRVALLAAVAALAVPAALGPPGPSARAADGAPVPSQAQVEAGRQQVTAAADQVGQIEAALAAAGARADTLSTDVAGAVEAYNGARVRLDAAITRARRAQLAADRAQQQVAASQAELGRFASAAYRSGGDLGSLSAVLYAESPHDLLSRASALASIGDSRRTTLESLRSAQAYATVLDRRAADLVAQRRVATREVAAAKSAAEARLAGQQRAVAEIASQRETLVRRLARVRHTSVRLERTRQAGLEQARQEALRRAAEQKAREVARAAEASRAAAAAKAAEDARAAAAEQARKDADARAAAAAADAAGSGGGGNGGSGGSGGNGGGGDSSGGGGGSEPPSSPSGGSSDPGGSGSGGSGSGGSGSAGNAPDPTPPGSSQGSSSGAQAAIDFARAQLGKPYRWAAAGPASFDCSGLTMRAWQQGGVSLPHYSVAQYAQSMKVALGELRPGDLVFFASGSDYRSIYHVGLYVGGGQMIEAPYTGESVRVSSIYRASLFGAARP